MATLTSGLLAGAHSITARYGGDGDFLPADSPPLSRTVNPAPASATFVGRDSATQGAWAARETQQMLQTLPWSEAIYAARHNH